MPGQSWRLIAWPVWNVTPEGYLSESYNSVLADVQTAQKLRDDPKLMSSAVDVTEAEERYAKAELDLLAPEG